jgi:hypothetical protein
VHDAAAVARSGDVEENEFVRTLRIVSLGALNRVARVTERLELHAFDHAAGVDVQTRDDATGEHGDSRFLVLDFRVPESRSRTESRI